VNQSNGLLDRLNAIKNSNLNNNNAQKDTTGNNKLKYFESTSISNSNESTTYNNNDEYDDENDTSASLSEKNPCKNFEDALKYEHNNDDDDEEDGESKHDQLFYGAHDMSDVDMGYTKRHSYEHYDDVKRNLKFDDDDEEEEEKYNNNAGSSDDDDEDTEHFENLKKTLMSAANMNSILQIKSDQPKSLSGGNSKPTRKKTKSNNRSLINTSSTNLGASFSSIASASTVNNTSKLPPPSQPNTKLAVKQNVAQNSQPTQQQTVNSKITNRTNSMNSLASASELFTNNPMKSAYMQTGGISMIKDVSGVNSNSIQLAKSSLKSSSMASFTNARIASNGRRTWN
jgi:hypothetical protein